MTEYFMARAKKGQEFMLDLSFMIAVPKTSRQKICDALNKLNYKLQKDQVWHVYHNDWYYNSHIIHQIKKYGKRMKIGAYDEY